MAEVRRRVDDGRGDDPLRVDLGDGQQAELQREVGVARIGEEAGAERQLEAPRAVVDKLEVGVAIRVDEMLGRPDVAEQSRRGLGGAAREGV